MDQSTEMVYASSEEVGTGALRLQLIEKKWKWTVYELEKWTAQGRERRAIG
jgi:hypothetical protein